ncbi:MAG: ABC transporter ATP-binding protein [Rickettsiales bacterium]|nr:ABC transporter ATP-binding protein [Rickettsiales bacterium]
MAVIRLSGVSKTYRIYNRPEDRLKQLLWRGRRKYFRNHEALKPLDLIVNKGETVGIVGRNGSGKSTLLQMVCKTLAPTSGSVEVQGRISALLELGAGFNPEFSGRDNIYMNAAILGLSQDEIDREYDAIVNFSGLEEHYLEQPVKTYSSGMYVRLAFSVAVSVKPDILVIDEALAVGDEGFQRKCFARIKELQEQGTSILFVSHAAQSVIELCDRAIMIDEGEFICDGEPKEVIAGYQRLIYAAREKRPAIREALKKGQLTAVDDKQESAPDALPTESRIEYEEHGGTISNPHLCDTSGQPVTMLQTGERYQFRYTVNYTEPATHPKYGMLIKTKRGINLGGAVALELAEQKHEAKADETVEVCFSFDCSLRPGHYFLNCGTTKLEGDEDIFVHRIVDALQFKVVDDREPQAIEPAGNIDLNVSCELKS